MARSPTDSTIDDEMERSSILGRMERRYICPSCGMKWFTLRHTPDWDEACGRCGTALVALVTPLPAPEPDVPPAAPGG